MYKNTIDRRGFLKIGGKAALALAAAPLLQAAPLPLSQAERRLSFFNTHTREKLESCYWKNGHYLPEALNRIDSILRDHRTGDVTRMDAGLLDLLCRLRENLATDDTIHIISGFRSPKTNEMLRRKGSGIARNSLHLYGKAIDIRIPGVPLKRLQRTALDLKAGGVGFYPASDFVHVDTGRIRAW